MPATSYAQSYIGSFRSPERLIQDRDVSALQVKYRFGEGRTGVVKRLSRLATTPHLWLPHRTGSLDKLEPRKYLGGLEITLGESTPVTAYNPENEEDRVYTKDQDNLLLHIHRFEGSGHMRKQLGQAAVYIAGHPELSSQSRVLCATYPPLARLALRAGFSEMVTTDAHAEYTTSINAYQKAYNATNSLRSAEPIQLPSTVAMPVHEFVDLWHPDLANTQHIPS